VRKQLYKTEQAESLKFSQFVNHGSHFNHAQNLLCRRFRHMAGVMNPTVAAQLGIKPFEAVDYRQSGEDCAQYLQACMDGAPEDAALFTKVVGDIARARGMMQPARDTGITREGLYKALG